MQPLGMLIRPTGNRLPILQMRTDGTIEVQGAHVTFETSIGAALRRGYRLEDTPLELRKAWEMARERLNQQQGICHAY
ncbi:MAG: hypothetical protein M0003_17980 [Acidithiobacillus sp.]|uniref:hypothetical protein n=1 Tax=Acidithiobacillus thiooxidans TaxID=930 RepID=UPI0009DAB074|nr:hypothetical protein [Acidithiobacillus thiooxidans]MDA8154575.1 hypothetical protein [Acidithiobacillus sp.]